MTTDRFGPIDFDRFHLEELPSRLSDRPRIFSAADLQVVRPIAFRLDDGRSYTYTPTTDGFAVAPGDETAHTVVGLAYDDWNAFAWELKSCFALFYAERLSFPRGSFGHLARWEPALRVAFAGQPIYDLTDPAPVVDDAGHPLDLHRTFTLGDSDTELRHFLERAGYLHLRGVMTDAELEALRADVTLGIERARPDDKRSWWTTVDGVDVCNRVNYLNDHSTVIAGLGADGRFLRIAALGGPDLREANDRLDGHGVVIKVPGATSGLADLPWHRDCGMGGHPVKCPLLNIGIQLDGATAGAGQLLVLAGSHRGTSRLPGPDELDGL
ncbi:MAG TPA: phytanoyl-CoA dioxygenase family protein, partial [Acidimicrobiales bacterium]|nr:phytanoyl-CoA dioxygenase family protein [Acidimicrobiales bacterium]